MMRMRRPSVCVSLLLLLPFAASLNLPSPRRIEPVRWACDILYARQRSRMGLTECQLGIDVELQSAGERKGQGVFARRTINQGELIGRYSAPVSNRETAAESSYSFQLRGSPFVLDAQDPRRSNWLRFVNHSRRRDNCIPVPASVRFLGEDINYAVVFQASKRIEVGEELLFDYGTRYWDRMFPNRWDPQRILIDYF